MLSKHALYFQQYICYLQMHATTQVPAPTHVLLANQNRKKTKHGVSEVITTIINAEQICIFQQVMNS